MTDLRSLIYSGHGDTLNYGFSDLKRATESYRKTLSYQPGDETLTFQYVEALYEQGRYEEGIVAVKGLRSRDPSDLDALLMLANLYWCDGEGAQALKYAFECIRCCEEWDHCLNTWIRDPEYYVSARGLIEEILLVEGEVLAEN